MSSNPNLRQVRLHWTGGLTFRGGPVNGPEVTIDSDGKEGPAPTNLLLMSLAGCMGVDVRMILEKSRVPVDSLEVEVIGERRDEAPRKFVRIELVYRIRGPGDEDEPKLQRAIELSRDKYCSVLHSLDPAIKVDLRVERS